MSELQTRACWAATTAVLLFLTASSSQAELFTSFQFTRIGGSNQVIAVPTTYYLVPRYRSLDSRIGPETWLVRLRNRYGVFTRSYQVGNSALAMQRAKRAYPNATLLSVRKR